MERTFGPLTNSTTKDGTVQRSFRNASAARVVSAWVMILCLGGLLGIPTVLPQRVAAQGVGETSSDIGNSELSEPEPLKGIPRDPKGILLALGWFVYPLGLTSIIAAWVAIERMVVLRRGRVIPKPFVKRFFDLLEEGKLDPKSAIKLCEENGSPMAAVLAHGVRKWGKPSVEVEQAIIDGGERQVSQLRSYLRVLNGAATVGPLLGLLGTVWGMVESFNTIALKSAMGKAEDLAAGIGLALLTTVIGLLIAIPSLVMYMYLAGRVDSLVMEMDAIAQELVDFISAEGLMEQQRSSRASLERSASSKSADARRAV